MTEWGLAWDKQPGRDIGAEALRKRGGREVKTRGRCGSGGGASAKALGQAALWGTCSEGRRGRLGTAGRG